MNFFDYFVGLEVNNVILVLNTLDLYSLSAMFRFRFLVSFITRLQENPHYPIPAIQNSLLCAHAAL